MDGDGSDETSGSGDESKREAATGIKLLCVVSGVGGFLAVPYLVRLFGFGGTAAAIGALIGAFAVVHYVALYGLWTLKEWGWTLGLAVYGLGIVIQIARGALIGVVVQALVFVYIMTRRGDYRDVSAESRSDVTE